MLLQGLVLLVAGAGIVFLFLGLLVAVLTLSSKIIPRFNHILPNEQPRMRVQRTKVPKPAVSHDDEITVAIAAVIACQRAAQMSGK